MANISLLGGENYSQNQLLENTKASENGRLANS